MTYTLKRRNKLIAVHKFLWLSSESLIREEIFKQYYYYISSKIFNEMKNLGKLETLKHLLT